jgi:LacI family transcriptional regulator
LSGSNHVSEETRQRVQDAAASLGYSPNRWARSLVTRKSCLIGLIVPDISHSFFAEITRGIQGVLEHHGYNLVLCNTNRDPRTEIREIDALRSAHVDGLLIASDQPEDNWRYFAGLAEQGQHFVLIDRYFDQLGTPHVGTDDFQAGRLATEHLIQLGHRAIAHVRGPAIRPARLRLEGYRDAVRKHKLKTCDSWLVHGNFQMLNSREAARFLMCLRERPTAIVAGNDNSAFGVIRGCREAGYRVPDDVSVIGIGNVEGDQHPNPFLTTVHWDRMEMGREAARILLAQIAAETLKPPAREVFAPSLLIRQSTAPPRPK